MKTKLQTLFFFFCLSNLGAQINLGGVVIDESTGQPLPFANVLTSAGAGAISNERGKFILELESVPKELIISYLGYTEKIVTIVDDKLFYPIKLKTRPLQLPEVEVLSSDEKAAALLYEAIENSRKLSYPLRHAKVFRRTYSTIDKGKPAELLEAFYNVSFTEGGVHAFELKNGRIGIPVERYILQLELCKILENYNFYGDKGKYFPASPLQEKSKRKLMKEYYVRYRNSSVSGRDTILEISFESKKTGHAFNGLAFVNKSDKNIVRVVHQIENADHVPFQTVINKQQTRVENMGLKWDTGFKYEQGVPVPRYMHVVFDIDYISKKGRSPLKSNTKLFFYDYEKQFTMPLFGAYAEMNDYDKIIATPYNAEFWKQAQLLPETGIEERFRKDLEFNRLFVNSDPTGFQIDLVNQKFMLVHEKPRPVWSKISPAKPTAEEYGNFYNNVDSYNCLYASCFLSIDYNCFPYRTQFKVRAVLDYSQSYMCNRTEPEALFFIKQLQFANLHARELEKQLTEKYKRKCPKRSELEQALTSAEKKLRKEIFSKFGGQNIRDDAYMVKLETLLMERMKKLNF